MFLPFFFRLEMLGTRSTGKELRGTSLKMDGGVTRGVVEPNQKKIELVFFFCRRVFIKGLRSRYCP